MWEWLARHRYLVHNTTLLSNISSICTLCGVSSATWRVFGNDFSGGLPGIWVNAPKQNRCFWKSPTTSVFIFMHLEHLQRHLRLNAAIVAYIGQCHVRPLLDMRVEQLFFTHYQVSHSPSLPRAQLQWDVLVLSGTTARSLTFAVAHLVFAIAVHAGSVAACVSAAVMFQDGQVWRVFFTRSC